MEELEGREGKGKMLSLYYNVINKKSFLSKFHKQKQFFTRVLAMWNQFWESMSFMDNVTFT